MNPQNSSQGGDALGPVGPASPQNPQPQDQQTVAANVIRTQIDALYGSDSSRTQADSNPREQAAVQRPIIVSPRTNLSVQQPATQNNTPTSDSTPEAANPYDRTHTPHPQPQTEQWKAYHSAWQNYYQKYYESYYHQKQVTEQTAVETVEQKEPSNKDYFAKHAQTAAPEELDEGEVGKDEALYELRQKLLGKVKKQATKIRGSKHFIPIVASLSVVLLFVFLQYNRVFIATVNAYVSPGSIDPQNIVIDPSAAIEVGPDPRLIIPKVNVDVPVLYDVGSDHASQMKAMESGVAHFAIPGANSKPGETGNTVLSGHSSNDLFDPGEYKFIFAQLEKMVVGDTIYANYGGVRYTYVVTKTEVVLPTQVDKLIYPTDKPILTLITCTPLGTAEKRLLITAEQISPNPSEATAAPQGSGETASDSNDIPGSSPTLLERLFGAR